MAEDHAETMASPGAGPDSDLKSRVSDRTLQNFAHEEREGLELAAKIRLGILIVIISWLAYDLPMTGAAYAYELAAIGVYILSGFAHLACARRAIGFPASVYGLFAFDIAFMGVAFSHTNPFIEFPDHSPTLLLLIPNFKWFFVFLMQAAFALTPRLVIWCGLWVVVVRFLQLAFFWSQGDFYTEAAIIAGDWQSWINAWYDPQFFSLQARVFELIFTLGMTFGLAAIVRRSRGLVLKRAATERARASLARYFSPNVVDALSINREQLDRTRVADVAVMFVDIKGFTRLCENIEPDQIADLLREYYRRLTDMVFAHHGTLDKFLGDGVMATFGTPAPRADCAAQALACGFAILAEIDRWNTSRCAHGDDPISVGVGLHYGPALIGNIGDDRRLEYAVVGDTVNVSSRVEGLTRQLQKDIAVTEDCIAAVRQSVAEHGDLLKPLRNFGEYPVKGRDKSVEVWSTVQDWRQPTPIDA